MKPSTRQIRRLHGWRLDRFIHNYIYFVFYYPYVKAVHSSLPVLKRLTRFKPLGIVARMIFDRYHAKVLSGGDTLKIFNLDRDIRAAAEANKQIIPYKYANRIIFQEPEFLAVMDCPCKLSTGTCGPVQSCIAVGKKIASFWLEHCAHYHARRITQSEALAIIADFRKRGHINQAFFKVATGGRSGVICNCCPDCCVSLQATMIARNIDHRLSQSAPAGYGIRWNAAVCTGCGQCADACHFGAVSWQEGRRVYHKPRCMGCELCVETCPADALSLYRDPDKPLPMDLDRIDSAG